MRELSTSDIERLDFLHNAIHRLLCELAGREIPWDMEVIGEISDVAEEHICNKLGLMSQMSFAPFIDSREG